MSLTYDLFDELPFGEDQQKNTSETNQQSKDKEGVNCPICSTYLKTKDERRINEHVDECLAKSFCEEKPKVTKTIPVKASTNTSQIKQPTKCVSCGVYDGHLTFCASFVKTNNPTTSSIPPPPNPPPVSYNNYYSHSYPMKKSSDSFNPFAVLCPYPSCGLKMEARDFVKHAASVHARDPQAFGCPVCLLLGYSGYSVKQDTNLFSHLQNTHADLFVEQQYDVDDLYDPIQNQEPDFVYDPEDFLVDEDPIITKVDIKSMSKTVGSAYVVETLKQFKPGFECSICYEEFQKGVVVARMDCFCVFHKLCIDNWFKKQAKCPLHKD